MFDKIDMIKIKFGKKKLLILIVFIGLFFGVLSIAGGTKNLDDTIKKEAINQGTILNNKFNKESYQIDILHQYNASNLRYQEYDIDRDARNKNELLQISNRISQYEDRVCECEESIDILTVPEGKTLIHQPIDKEKINGDLEKIQKAIEITNSQWNASFYPSILNMYFEEGKGLGCIDEYFHDYQTVPYNGTVPDIFDWRDVNGTDWTTPIKDQDNCGSCTAFGILGALEAIIQLNVGTPFACDLSESHLFFGGGGHCQKGMKISEAISYLTLFGVSEELCCPYFLGKTGYNEMPKNWEERTVKIQSGNVISYTFDNIKNALLQYGPLVTSLEVYEDFYAYDGGIYSHVSGEYVGRHCVTLVGYNNEKGYWICKNSWGNQWGENGWFNIKFGQCSIGETTLYLSGISGNIQPFPPTNPTPSHNATNITCTTTLHWTSNDPNNDTLIYKLYLTEGHNVLIEDPYRVIYNHLYYQLTNLKSNTTYSWKIVAEDEHGSQTEGQTWKFTTIENKPPQIKIIHPQQNHLYWRKKMIPLPFTTPIILGECEILGIANDESGIKEVLFYVNDMYKSKVTQEPYKWKWEKYSPALKQYKITMEAYDIHGNSAKDEILVLIFNPAIFKVFSDNTNLFPS